MDDAKLPFSPNAFVSHTIIENDGLLRLARAALFGTSRGPNLHRPVLFLLGAVIDEDIHVVQNSVVIDLFGVKHDILAYIAKSAGFELPELSFTHSVEAN